MTVHLSGDGAGWTGIETLDVDQPHGLDYRQLNHLAIALRKRIAKEHVTFGDSTAGGEHDPGGARILGIVENTSDLSKGYGDASWDVTTNRFLGRGLIYDQTNNAFWCTTNSDGTTTNDPYLLRIHPDRGWNGGDITWAGAHEFDASVDISGNVAMDGDLTVDGSLVVDGTSDINAQTTFAAQVNLNSAAIGALKSASATVFNATMTAADTFQSLDLSGTVGANIALVYIEVKASGNANYAIKPNGQGGVYARHDMVSAGAGFVNFDAANDFAYVIVMTDSNGLVQHGSNSGGTTFTVKILGYIR